MAEEVILKIVEGSLKGEEFVFDEDGLCLIGRSADCALQIPKEKDMRISRRHCLLVLEPPNVRIRDLGSRNGTMVNGELLEPGVISEEPEKMTSVDRILKDGDVLCIGETVMNVEIPSEKIPEVSLSQTKPQTKKPQGTKIIKLNKPENAPPKSPITKGKAVSSGFFAPPSTDTASRNIAMTEAIPREDMKHRNITGTPSLNMANNSGIIQAKGVTPPQAPGNSGPLAPPRPEVKEDGGKTMISPTASGPVNKPQKAPVLVGKIVNKPPQDSSEQIPSPESPAAEQNPEPKGNQQTKIVAPVAGPKGTKVITKKRSDEQSPQVSGGAPASSEAAEQPKVLKAKIVKPGSLPGGKSPKKLQGNMKTIVMDTKEFEEMPSDMIEPPSEESEPVAGKRKKRVTKFKVKGPN